MVQNVYFHVTHLSQLLHDEYSQILNLNNKSRHDYIDSQLHYHVVRILL